MTLPPSTVTTVICFYYTPPECHPNTYTLHLIICFLPLPSLITAAPTPSLCWEHSYCCCRHPKLCKAAPPSLALRLDFRISKTSGHIQILPFPPPTD
ncbi:hypothetical protein BGW80DRAFT_603948 [Lactifluus volemus]|nr:hypothetical protein BGW80DRAFT_603948 [Lactifluus volemus]